MFGYEYFLAIMPSFFYGIMNDIILDLMQITKYLNVMLSQKA